MKERQRWRAEEDAILRAYVKQYGAREWNLVSQRMNVFLERDAKSCLERWKNYLRPGIKKGSLTEEEQRLVITLQSKHGNKWKKIAAEVPGRTAKRLGKWWEVFKEKQQRQLKQSNRANSSCIDPGKYDRILESFAEKLVKQQQQRQLLAAAPPLQLPPWLTSSPTGGGISLSPTAPPAAPWPLIETTGMNLTTSKDAFLELAECCGELEKGYHAWAEHKKEASWRLKRVELQLEAEKACKKKEKNEEFESMMRKLWEEQQQALERIEFDCMKHLLVVMKDAEAMEQMLTELWASKYAALSKLLLQMSCDRYH